jgi:metallo-beta-lactamase family protein
MKLSFYGAAREVTGSCYHLEANRKRILIDCGMQQGKEQKDNQYLSFAADQIDIAVLTHAHIDHSGRLPLLVKNGYSGKIYATRATCDLLDIMLRDSAYIQKMDAHWENHKGKRAGKDPVEPMYTLQDVEETLKLLSPCEYRKSVPIADGIDLEFTDAGHLLGSSSVHFQVREGDQSKRIVFSGDIGNIGQPIIRDPQYIEKADYVVMESTYGDRNHEHQGHRGYNEDLAQIVEDTFKRGGNVVIPSFAVGRTQELLYFFREIKEKNLIPDFPGFKVYVDSPLASAATRIYDGDLRGYADEETIEVLRKGDSPTGFDGLVITESTDESKAINFDSEPKVIISSSGMCEAGRIRHHLKHNLWREDSTVVFVGFQANGTLGRYILEGVERVKLFGEEIVVKASIINFRGLSAHADRDGLLKWIQYFQPKPEKIFVVHGDSAVCDIFQQTLEELDFDAVAPNYHSKYDMLTGEVIHEGVTTEFIREQKQELRQKPDVYSQLLQALERLTGVIRQNKNRSKNDLIRLTEQVTTLAEKWKRK